MSRSTNDVEAIQDMLETGFDGLITAILTLGGTAVLLVVLDVHLGLVCLAAFPILVALIWWFRNEYWVDELGYYELVIKTECFE